MKSKFLKPALLALTISLVPELFHIPNSAQAQSSQQYANSQVLIKLHSLSRTNLTSLINKVRPLGGERITSILNPDSILDFSSQVSTANIDRFISDVNASRGSLQSKASPNRLKRATKDSSAPLTASLVIHFRSSAQVQIVLGEIVGLPFVLDASLNKLLEVSSLPNDYFVDGDRNGVLDYNNSTKLPWSWHYTAVGAEHLRTQTGKGILVAIIDDGMVEPTSSSLTQKLHNPELSDQFWINPGEIPNDGVDNDRNGYVDDVHGANIIADEGCKARKISCSKNLISTPWSRAVDFHGVFVSSLIAAKRNNGLGMAGIADGVKLMGVKVLDGFSGVSSDPTFKANNASTIAMGILYAVRNGADVINMSLGGKISSLMNQEYTIVRDAIKFAKDSGVIMVAAAGNDGSLGSDMYPGAFDEVISVAATNINSQISAFSNYGSTVDLSAPGEYVVGMSPSALFGFDSNPYSGSKVNQSYYFKPARGTSFSSPIVAATVALLLEKNPSLKQEEILTILKQTATPINGTTKGIQGGIVNVKRALDAVKSPNGNGVNPQFKQNPVLNCDVNNDGRVTALDLLSVVNYLNSKMLVPHYFYDVNGDNIISSLDLLSIVNYLRGMRG